MSRALLRREVDLKLPISRLLRPAMIPLIVSAHLSVVVPTLLRPPIRVVSLSKVRTLALNLRTQVRARPIILVRAPYRVIPESLYLVNNKMVTVFFRGRYFF